MPTYDYECSACGHAWELFQNITADPIKKCPACNKRKAVRLFGTGAALMFKGSGFYETDYRSDSYKKSAKAETQKPASDQGSSSNDKSKSSSAQSNTDKSKSSDPNRSTANSKTPKKTP